MAPSLLRFSNIAKILSSSSKDPAFETRSLLLSHIFAAHLSSFPNRPMRGDPRTRDPSSEDQFLRNLDLGDDEDAQKHNSHQNRPPRGGKSSDLFLGGLDEEPPEPTRPQRRSSGWNPNRTLRGERRGEIGREPPRFSDESRLKDFDSKEKRTDPCAGSLLEKLNLGKDGGERTRGTQPKPAAGVPETDPSPPEAPVQDADEIFRKMKETGLIPNAVAMLDGLCKDGLVQEAMKLFGSMREKGTIPEVVIYTAVVEGFCKAAKFDDAKRIFRKMQKNGIVPNAFSYGVIVQWLSRGRRVEDAVELCMEMLDAGHSPNPATFTGMVDALCKEKGKEEAEGVVGRLRERGFPVDDKAVREHMDKKGPFSPMVWEAIFGSKASSQRLF